MLLDQATRAHGAWLPFFGRPAPTPLGVARMARRRGVPLVPAAMLLEGGRWTVHHLAPIEPDEAADARELTARCSRALEELVLRNIAQWVWFHDRWNVEPGR